MIIVENVWKYFRILYFLNAALNVSSMLNVKWNEPQILLWKCPKFMLVKGFNRDEKSWLSTHIYCLWTSKVVGIYVGSRPWSKLKEIAKCQTHIPHACNESY